jgi:hypothetical protein
LKFTGRLFELVAGGGRIVVSEVFTVDQDERDSGFAEELTG